MNGSSRTCTCGCGRGADADYWHAWQAGRIHGWHEGTGRPLWWLRLRFRVAETAWPVMRANGRSGAS